MSLRAKILCALLVFVTLVFALLTVRLLLEVGVRAREETARKAEVVARVIDAWVVQAIGREPADSEEFWREVAARIGATALLRSYRVVEWSPQGGPVTRLARGRPASLDEQDRRLLEEVRASGRTVVRGGRATLVLGRLPEGGMLLAELEVPEPLASGPLASGAIREILVVMAIGTVLILLVSYVLLDRFVLRPLQALAAASAAVAAGQLDRRIPEPAGVDEMARTIQAFNRMVERLREYHERLQGQLRQKEAHLRDTRTRLLAAQRLSATGALAAGIAHEVNNPLSGMINLALRLRDRGLSEEERQRALSLILEGLERIRGTVERLLRFAPRPAVIRPVRLADVIEGVRGLVEHRLRERNIRFGVRGIDGLPEIRGDPGELQQVFLNLVVNAVDACPPQGGSIEVEGEQDGAFLKVRVRDNGIGMDEEQLRTALLPFQTSKPEGRGTGLGLPVARSILEHYGGDLHLESRRGCGTTAHVWLSTSGRADANLT